MSSDTAGVELATALLSGAFDRVSQDLPLMLSGLSAAQLLWRPGPAANSMGWLAWHLSRVQDDHVAGVAGRPQVWLTQGWEQRFALGYPADEIGYGHSSEQVAVFRVSDPALLVGYYEAVATMTTEVLADLTAVDFDRIVDERWDPPVTAAVRLVSVINDVTQHLGQVAYLRGLLGQQLIEGPA